MIFVKFQFWITSLLRIKKNQFSQEVNNYDKRKPQNPRKIGKSLPEYLTFKGVQVCPLY